MQLFQNGRRDRQRSRKASEFSVSDADTVAFSVPISYLETAAPRTPHRQQNERRRAFRTLWNGYR